MKAGKVLLSPNSLDVMNIVQTVELTQEMVGWPIKLNAHDYHPVCYQKMFRAALSLSESGFTVYISMGVNHEKKLMYPPVGGCESFSGLICLNDDILVSFLKPEERDDSSRYFSSIVEWAEEYSKSEVVGWTSNQWKEFFLKRITSKLSAELSRAAQQAEIANKNLDERQKRNDSVLDIVKTAEEKVL